MTKIIFIFFFCKYVGELCIFILRRKRGNKNPRTSI
jgi:hypothetical protein